MQEEADLVAYSDYLCSCQAVVTKLRGKGVLTLHDEQHARSFLGLQEHTWPNEPTIADDAELFLDGLSVTYLQTVGMLDKLSTPSVSSACRTVATPTLAFPNFLQENQIPLNIPSYYKIAHSRLQKFPALIEAYGSSVIFPYRKPDTSKA
jgi:hypothetical protein